MSKLLSQDFTQNGTVDGEVVGTSLILMVVGTFGEGTLNVKIWSESRDEFRTIASLTAPTDAGREIYLGSGQRLRFELVGATAPSIEIDYWFV